MLCKCDENTVSETSLLHLNLTLEPLSIKSLFMLLGLTAIPQAANSSSLAATAAAAATTATAATTKAVANVEKSE